MTGEPANPLLPIELVSGDIGETAQTRGPWLAVVSGDDSMLSHSGGASASIWEAAGDLEPSEDELPARLGSIVRTGSGGLEADIVLHAVTVDVDRWVGLDSVQYAAMIDRLGNILAHWVLQSDARHSDGLHRVLMPLLGTGVGGISLSLAIRETERLALRLADSGIRLVLAATQTRQELEHLAGVHLQKVALVSLDRDVGGPGSPLGGGKSRSPRRNEGRSGRAGGGGGDQSFQPWRAQDMLERDQALKHSQGFFRSQRQDRFRGDKGGGGRRAQVTQKPTGPVKIAEPITIKDLSAVTGVKAADILKQLFLAGTPATIDSSIETDQAVEIMMGYDIELQVEEAKTAAEVIEQEASKEPEVEQVVDPIRPLESSVVISGRRVRTKKPLAHGEPIKVPGVHTHQAPHVERLVDLLHDLDGLERDDLDEWMRSLGYKGEPRLRLKELCIRMDPAVVVERLGAARIRHLLKTEFGRDVPPQLPLPGLIAGLLGECGFLEIPEPRGLRSAIREIERLGTSLVMSEPHDQAGIVLDVSGRFEAVVRDLLRFVCLHVHEAGPERHLKGVANYDGRPLASTTLGMMLTLLRELAKSFSPESSELAADLNGALLPEHLVPSEYNAVVAELVPIRNNFAHASKHGEAHGDPEASLKKARRFVELVTQLLKFWSESPRRVYPSVVRVDRITIDRWNRRLIEAVDDSGADEAIVCDDEIHPGRLYYMLPRTNPFRVDPILIEFGQVGMTKEPTPPEGA